MRGKSRKANPSPSRTPARRGGRSSSVAEEKLERDVGSHRPGLLVVARTREGQVEEVFALAIAACAQGVAHDPGGLVVVARPAAVEVDLDRPLGLALDPPMQVVAEAEGARQAAGVAED